MRWKENLVKHRKVSKYYETDCRSKAIEQIEFVEQLKELDANDNATDVGNNQSMLVLTILEKKNQRNEIKTFSRKCNSLIKDGNLSRSES